MAPALVAVAGCGTMKTELRVGVPVVDLRAEPHTRATPAIHDPLQETQLLYGERVLVHRRRDGWAYIEALEQSEFSHRNRWEGYPGWVPESTLIHDDLQREPNLIVTAKWAPAFEDPHLTEASPWRFPMGTRLRGLDYAGQFWRIELYDGSFVWMRSNVVRSLRRLRQFPPQHLRQEIIASAAQLIGDPYYWGGRSPSLREPDGSVLGVDCSGLVNLAYRTVGIDIPRDAHEQSLKARPIARPKPADLVFLSESGHPERIVHVMLYAGRGELIEGPGTDQAVRRIAVATRLGRPLDELSPGDIIEEQTVSFGSYLP